MLEENDGEVSGSSEEEDSEEDDNGTEEGSNSGSSESDGEDGDSDSSEDDEPVLKYRLFAKDVASNDGAVKNQICSIAVHAKVPDTMNRSFYACRCVLNRKLVC